MEEATGIGTIHPVEAKDMVTEAELHPKAGDLCPVQVFQIRVDLLQVKGEACPHALSVTAV